ncbi:MAG TPA: hypothetical protein VGL45_11120, partial [Bradyrhizobium sp.]
FTTNAGFLRQAIGDCRIERFLLDGTAIRARDLDKNQIGRMRGAEEFFRTDEAGGLVRSNDLEAIVFGNVERKASIPSRNSSMPAMTAYPWPGSAPRRNRKSDRSPSATPSAGCGTIKGWNEGC